MPTSPRTKPGSYKVPAFRQLQIFTVDPHLGQNSDVFDLSVSPVEIRWEEDLKTGPRGNYIEVFDYEPSLNVFYEPIDLNHPHVLAHGGLYPSEGDPKFHQQMVYAVGMHTIENFERALGRTVLWSPRRYGDVKKEQEEAGVKEKGNKGWNKRVRKARYVDTLRIYPHALRERNAYYDPVKKSLLFGYFPADDGFSNERGRQAGLVFTCLSFDIIAHEMTHAILDGIHPEFVRDTNPDVPAFHEAFSDLVALFQRFQFTDLLKHEIAASRGNLTSNTMLAKLAIQFGLGAGRGSALRDALGEVKGGVWSKKSPVDARAAVDLGAHDRGALLVSAIFDAFLTIFNRRTADLVRLASGGTGELRPGAIPIELVDRMSDEAAKTARHFLGICIRALDYVAPVDITFEEYLRGMLTADYDVAPKDEMGYRVAIVESFRKWGIVPDEGISISPESLRWDTFQLQNELQKEGVEMQMKVETWMEALGGDLKQALATLNYGGEREAIYEWSNENQAAVHDRINGLACGNLLETISEVEKVDPKFREFVENVFGVYIADKTESKGKKKGTPKFSILSVRPSIKVSLNGGSRPMTDIIITLLQKKFIDDSPEAASRQADDSSMDGYFLGGSTIVFSLDKMEIKYAIRKGYRSERRMKAQLEYEAKKRPLYSAPSDEQFFRRLHMEEETF